MNNTPNTTPDFLFGAIMNVVNQHISALIEDRLKSINEAAITDYVQRAVEARITSLTPDLQKYILAKIWEAIRDHQGENRAH